MIPTSQQLHIDIQRKETNAKQKGWEAEWTALFGLMYVLLGLPVMTEGYSFDI